MSPDLDAAILAGWADQIADELEDWAEGEGIPWHDVRWAVWAFTALTEDLYRMADNALLEAEEERWRKDWR
jgi:hypothetical protein